MVDVIKHYYKLIRDNQLKGYISALILLFLATLISITLLSSSYTLYSVTEDMKESNVEDFQFYLYDSEKLNDLENRFNFKSEVTKMKYYSSNNTKTIITVESKSINKPSIQDGRSVENSDEIVLDVNQMSYYDLNDNFTIDNKEYNVVGFAFFPNFIQPNLSYNAVDNYVTSKDNSIVLVSNSVYDNFDLNERIYYSGIWNDTNNEENLAKNLDYFLSKEDNPEIGVLESSINVLKQISYLAMSILLFVVIILVITVIANIISDSSSTIGVLTAIGVRKRNFIIPQLFIVLPFALSVICGFLFSRIFASKVVDAIANNYILPSITINVNLFIIILIVCLVILLLFMVTSIYTLTFLRGNIIKLIYGSNKFKLGRFKKFVFNKLLSRKHGDKSIFNKVSLSNFVVVFLVFFTGYSIIVQTMIGYSVYNFPNNTIDNYKKNVVYDYRLQYTDVIEYDKDVDGQSYLFVNANDLNIEVLYNSNYKAYNFTDSKNNDINAQLENGVILNHHMAIVNDYSIGDKISLTINNEEYEVVISGISSIPFGDTIYTSEEYFKTVLDNEIGIVNGIYSNTIQDEVNVLNFQDNEKVVNSIKQSVSGYSERV